ncbi:MAG: SAM-dependent methyltransferase [Methylobacteriaceae bacterium]|jgi:SAM-dependent MidA family methyltransferase|nr:SAM-dependent methyltransferase [Methylobacteriaceae bacterium]
MTTTLEQYIRDAIIHNGPMRLDHYMTLAGGWYYDHHMPFGHDGDFVTAPEICHLFGELIGLWMAHTWGHIGLPLPARWVELGPGRGTLTRDAWRALGASEIRNSLTIYLVENSPTLAAVQQQTLAGLPAHWHTHIEEVLDSKAEGAVFLVANEFFDALPVRQFVRGEQHWHERVVGLLDGALVLGLAREPLTDITLTAPPGTVMEWPGAARQATAAIADLLKQCGGLALIIDYGYRGPRFGDTLQAVRNHRHVSPLDTPGDADITSHVDFNAIAGEAKRCGLNVHGLTSQGDFLRGLGIEVCLNAVEEKVDHETADRYRKAVRRLTGGGRENMGELFKVMGLTSPDITALSALPPYRL